MKDQRSEKGAHDLDVTDEQVEEALSRLFRAVRNEPVPEAWRERPGRQSTAKVQGSKPNPHYEANEEERATMSKKQGLNAMPDARLPLVMDTDGQLADQAARVPARKRNRTKRRWATATAAAAIAGVMLFTSWGQDVMASMLSTFRVQHFETISFTESDMNGFRQALENGTLGTRQMDLRLYGEIEQTGGGTQRTIDAAEAEKLAGRPLKALPGADSKTIDYMPEQSITFKLHPKEINKLIALLGGKEQFPASIDGAPIKLVMPGSFTMSMPDSEGFGSKQLMQLPSPAIDVPDDVDIEQVRRAVLGLPILPDDLRAKLSAIGDWRHTLPVPTMDGVGKDVRTVSIDGNDAILSTTSWDRSVMWLKNDWMYMLSGSLKDYPTDNDIMKEAKGLMGS